jgi:hypothetical protein
MKNVWLWVGLIVATLILMGKKLVASPIEAMARAIQEFEGWYEGSVSQRNNNPGNLKYAGQPGAIGEDQYGHAIFDSFTSGWNALIRQLQAAFYGTSQVYSPTDTLYEFFSKYAEGNSQAYAEFVAGELGVAPTYTLQQIIGGSGA